MTKTAVNAIQKIEQFPSQMVQFIQLLEDFHKVLLSESQALKSSDTEQLSTILSVKNQLSEKLSLLTQTIESQLNAKQLTLSMLFSPDLSSNLPTPLQKNIQRIITLSSQCHDLNQSNGISIQILSNINQYTLNLVSGKESPNVKLYCASGETQTSESAKKSLGKA